jgi:putative DNA primase/helicase
VAESQRDRILGHYEGGRNGFVQSWRATANGLEAIAEHHNDLALFLDELGQMDAREAAETAYLLGNGTGKTRMSRNIGARKKLLWSLLFVSAGEITLADHALTAGKRTKGGAEVRLLNIEADAGAGLLAKLGEPIRYSPVLDASLRRADSLREGAGP